MCKQLFLYLATYFRVEIMREETTFKTIKVEPLGKGS